MQKDPFIVVESSLLIMKVNNINGDVKFRAHEMGRTGTAYFLGTTNQTSVLVPCVLAVRKVHTGIHL